MSPRSARSIVEVEPHLWQAPEADPSLTPTPVAFRVLASSSSGNCSVLVFGEGGTRRAVLIDAGISPRRTARALAEMGLTIEHVDSIVFTHLDSDHCYSSWTNALPRHARFIVAQRHRGRAERMGILERRTTVFADSPFTIRDWVRVHPLLLSHDSLGVAAFRLEFANAHSLGYATDVGTPTPEMVGHFRGVEWLAIESNYCPRMQIDSGRPKFLIDRIMGGAGHLSNEQSASLVGAIGPKNGCVLLHLSRQCNTPATAAGAHTTHGVEIVVAEAAHPTQTIDLTRVT